MATKKTTKQKKRPGFQDALRGVMISSVFIALSVFASVAALILIPRETKPQIQSSTFEDIAQVPAESNQDEGVLPTIDAALSSELSPPVSSPVTTPASPRVQQPVRRSVTASSGATSVRAGSRQMKPPESGTPAATTISAGYGAGRQVPIERTPEPVPKQKGQIAIILDDAGNNLHELEPFLRFPGPLTIAVLPGLPYSVEAARRIRASGKEVILHQPMEAIGGQNPGPSAIYAGMTEEEIWAILKKNVAEIGPVSGMNNHQGSKITADEQIMKTVLSFCRQHGLYYVDSRTTAETVVPAVAAKVGLQIRERDVFIDNIQEKAAMIRYIQEGLQKSEKKGAAVMIGHVWSSELAATLEELYPELIAQGFSLTTVSRIMMGTFEDEGFGD
ncbi:MAG: divergent polysaccharide deacetylase family protein [Termitinemataceae bacterium]